ncbi:DUF4397 domain-containing protein [Ferrimonas gelatinilytica]|uniref:DUF4397 domain-containing protein n=1 Tax=Ferrimonas gelatinilytica TaxID=1255257 RepID=A0ABP9RVI6_9GAMM
MNAAKRLVAVAFASLAITACSDSDDDVVITTPPTPSPGTGYVRVLHASPDAPKVNVMVNGAAALEAVDYAVGSGFIALEEDSYEIAVDAILPGGDTTTVVGPASIPIDADTEYSVVAVGKAGDGTLEPLILSRPKADFGAGNIRLQVLHASPDAPAVDIYLTAPGDDISMMDPALAAVPFKASSDLIEVASGDYQVRVTLPDSKEPVFDTGALTLEAGTDLMLVAINNTLTGASPINVVAWSSEGVALVSDVKSGSEVRVVHASPDAPAVNVLVDDAVALTDVPFPAASGYLGLAEGAHNVKVEPSAAPGTYVIDADVELVKNTAYTVLAINEVANIAPLVLTDDRRRIATEVGLRLIHASPTAGEVDIYVGADNDISDEEPAFTAVPIGAETGRVALPAGTYYVTVAPTGTKEGAIGPLMLELEAGKLYTAVARDEVGGGLPLGVILLDDFIAQQ